MKKWITIAFIVLMLMITLSMGVSAESTVIDSVHLTDQELSDLNSDLVANELEPIGEHRVMKIFMGSNFEYAFQGNKNLDEVLLESVPLYAIEGEGDYRYYYYDEEYGEKVFLIEELPNHANNEMAFFFDYALSPAETFSSTVATANLKDLVFYEVYCMDGYESFFGALLIYYKTNQGDFIAYSSGRSVYPKDQPIFEYLMPLSDFRQAMKLATQETIYAYEQLDQMPLGGTFFSMSRIVNLIDLQSYVIGNTELPDRWYQTSRTPEEVAAWEAARKNNTENNPTTDPAPTDTNETADDGCASVVPSGVGLLTLCGAAAVIVTKKKKTKK